MLIQFFVKNAQEVITAILTAQKTEAGDEITIPGSSKLLSVGRKVISYTFCVHAVIFLLALIMVIYLFEYICCIITVFTVTFSSGDE